MRACTLGLVLVFALIGANGASQISVRNKNLNSIGELLDKLTSKLLLEETQMHDLVVERKAKADAAYAQKTNTEEKLTPLAKNVSDLKAAIASSKDSVKSWESRQSQVASVIEMTRQRHGKEQASITKNRKSIAAIE